MGEYKLTSLFSCKILKKWNGVLQWRDQQAREKWSTWGAEEVKKKREIKLGLRGKMEPAAA